MSYAKIINYITGEVIEWLSEGNTRHRARKACFSLVCEMRAEGYRVDKVGAHPCLCFVIREMA